MCGIAGIFDCRGQAKIDGALQRMTGILSHRGPDGDRLFLSPRGVGLGHHRLAIIGSASGRGVLRVRLYSRPHVRFTVACTNSHRGIICSSGTRGRRRSRASARSTPVGERDYSAALWSLSKFEAFCARYIPRHPSMRPRSRGSQSHEAARRIGRIWRSCRENKGTG
jgi:hypothetical protein